MRLTRLLIPMFAVAVMLALAGCAADTPSIEPAGEYSRLVMSVALPGPVADRPAAAPALRSGFENFDNEQDKWGVKGENIEQLRIIILDSDGSVEHNNLYSDLSDATLAGAYEYKVRNNDLKTVILLANEKDYLLDEEGMEIVGGTHSLSVYLNSFAVNTRLDVDELKALTVALKQNSPDDKGLSLKTPLPISAIHTEYIATTPENETVERTYTMHRAAVKYSFRIINKSNYDHKLEGIRINRIADREFLFPNATYTTNELGHQVIESYSTPSTAREQAYENSGFSLSLPKGMTQAVQAMPAIYVPEGLSGEEAQQVSIALDGAPLEIWKDLEWLMPGEENPVARPMVDLPRNTHVVVNITINDDNTMDFVADVQPYANVVLQPPFGLDRDDDGNIIVERHPDGTYDVIVDSQRITKDADGDEVRKKFSDGSFYCIAEVLKDYIHGGSEVDYIYHYEKDYSGGNMIIIREKSLGGQYHGTDLPEHDHGYDDKAVFLLNKNGDFEYVTYDKSVDANGKEVWKVKSRSRTDMKGDTITQANGFQFRNEGDMSKYIGTYVVQLADGSDELRWYADGSVCDWDTGKPLASMRSRAAGSVSDKARVATLLQAMRKANRLPLQAIGGKGLRRH